MTNRKILSVIHPKIKKAVADDIKHARSSSGMALSRHQVADKMTEIAGEEITASMLYNWTAKSHITHRFPIIYLPAFVQATRQRRLLKLLIEESFTEEDTLKKEIETINLKINRLKNRKHSVELLLRGKG